MNCKGSAFGTWSARVLPETARFDQLRRHPLRQDPDVHAAGLAGPSMLHARHNESAALTIRLTDELKRTALRPRPPAAPRPADAFQALVSCPDTPPRRRRPDESASAARLFARSPMQTP